MKTIFSLLVLSSSFAFAGTHHMEACVWKEIKHEEIKVIASNIANMDTTRTPEGGPYLRKRYVCKTMLNCKLVEYSSVKMKSIPNHPDANAAGIVFFPDIDIQVEMDDMKKAGKEYNAFAAECS